MRLTRTSAKGSFWKRLLLALLVFGTSCKGDGSGGREAMEGRPVPLEDLCATYLDDLCTTLVRCKSSGYPSVAQCRADLDCTGLTDLVEEVASGWVEYRPEEVGRCHARIRADPCKYADMFLIPPTIPEVLVNCPGTVIGKRPLEATCIGDQDCVPGAFCLRMGCAGVCKPLLRPGQRCDSNAGRCDRAGGWSCRDGYCRRTPVAEGDECQQPSECSGPDLWCDTAAKACRRSGTLGQPCGAGNSVCARGLHCEAPPGSAGICQGPAAAGGRCREDLDCQPGLSCVRTAQDGWGSCRAKGEAGASCGATENGPCADGFRCGTSGRCEPLPPLPSLGQPCRVFVDKCASGLVCAPGDVPIAQAGVCKHARYVGDSCGEASSICLQTACRAQTCQALAPIGDACAAGFDCRSRTCRQGRCVDPLGCWGR